MKRFCYFCRKPLGIEKRAEMFCNLRCQKLHAQLSQGTERFSFQSPGHARLRLATAENTGASTCYSKKAK